jgi:hypothetical protein
MASQASHLVDPVAPTSEAAILRGVHDLLSSFALFEWDTCHFRP